MEVDETSDDCYNKNGSHDNSQEQRSLHREEDRNQRVSKMMQGILFATMPSNDTYRHRTNLDQSTRPAALQQSSRL